MKIHLFIVYLLSLAFTLAAQANYPLIGVGLFIVWCIAGLWYIYRK